MKTYPKTETLFNRNKETFKVKEGDFRRQEYTLINSWFVTEKIDGQNIRLHWNRSTFEPSIVTHSVGGRTDKAQLNSDLVSALLAVMDRVHPEVEKIMDEHDLNQYCLFGEGYGPGIQRGGGRYRDDKGFILFDILIDDKQWLAPDLVWRTAERLGINHVPVMGTNMSTEDAVALAKSAYRSIEANDQDYIAEGIIAKTRVPLYTGHGDRVQWKLKASDFA